MAIHWTEYPERVETFGDLLGILETLDCCEMEAGFTAPDFQKERGQVTAYTVDFHSHSRHHQFHPQLDQMPGLEHLIDRFDIDGFAVLTQSQARELRRRVAGALNRDGASLNAMRFTEIVDALDAGERPPVPPGGVSIPPATGINTFGDFLANVSSVEQAAVSCRQTADAMNSEPGTGYSRIQAEVYEADAEYRKHPSFPHLEAHVNRLYGSLNHENLLRVRGDVCAVRQCGSTDADGLAVEEVVAAVSHSPDAAPVAPSPPAPPPVTDNSDPPLTVNDIRELLRYREARAAFDAQYRSMIGMNPVTDISRSINLTHWSAYNCPQPGRLTEEAASTFAVYRRLRRESLAMLKSELNEQSLLYVVGEVAARHGRAIAEMWPLTIEAFGLLWEFQPPERTGTGPDAQSARGHKEDDTNDAPDSSGDTSHAGAGRFVFAACGTTYHIAGFGEEGHLLGSLKGLSTIARLLQTPGVAVPWRELEPAILKDAPRTGQPALEGAEGLWREYRRLQAEVEDTDDEVEKADSQHRLDELATQLRSVTGLKGKARDLNSLTDKVRPKLWGRITTVIGKLREATPPMPLLADHFEKFINSGANGFVYDPPTPAPCWQTKVDKK